METIKITAKMFGLAEHFVRNLVLSGKIVAVKAGRKYLVNVDKLAEYLDTNTLEAVQENTEEAHGINPIPVKM